MRQLLNKKGFTLIELLLVIAIVGVLAGVSIQSFSGSQAKARDSRRKADLKAIQQALEQYYNDNGRYPVTPRALWDCSPSAPTVWIRDDGTLPVASQKPLGSNYIATIPNDPRNGQPSGNPIISAYEYCYYSADGINSGTPGQEYILIAMFENSHDPQLNNSVRYGNSTYAGPGAGFYHVANP
jgi:type II secretion system protein G